MCLRLGITHRDSVALVRDASGVKVRQQEGAIVHFECQLKTLLSHWNHVSKTVFETIVLLLQPKAELLTLRTLVNGC
jgi:hypothetical protein